MCYKFLMKDNVVYQIETRRNITRNLSNSSCKPVIIKASFFSDLLLYDRSFQLTSNFVNIHQKLEALVLFIN
ncbi:hypothetical protein FRX31_006919 [Thalictrum thalictroides]|uniref:Uncharacterized protein n=1 Tax=Thalictrum thalictroides TaxID=46969 RepID=A0A7J6X3W9_THATH|nr:hypothetical protein FRX31_006919 [Thalictrum thalictroides]